MNRAMSQATTISDEALRLSLQRDGLVRVAPAFAADVAHALYDHLSGKLEWWRAVNRVMRPLLLAVALLCGAGESLARESLGVFEGWGAFRDPNVPRCYAIAMAQPSSRQRDYQPYASVATWPKRSVRGQAHFRMSRQLAQPTRITLSISGRRFDLEGGGGDAWAADPRMDAAIVAAMRSAQWMTVTARDSRGRRFSDSWQLTGAATAMDAATVGCARLR